MRRHFDFIRVETKEDVLVVEITTAALNDFDIVHAVADEVELAMRESPSTKLVLNLARVELLNSLGLVVFVRLLKTASDSAKYVVLCCAHDVVAAILKTSRLAFQETVQLGHMAIASDVDAAIAALDGV